MAELRERALWPLARQAHCIAARSALKAANSGTCAQAGEHAHQALALATRVDPWTDGRAAVWLDAAAILGAAGAAGDAEAALASGRAWVAQAADELADAPDRTAWCELHPLHRALQAGR